MESIRYCKLNIEYKDRWGVCPVYGDCRCCAKCQYAFECERECESGWFYTDCDCHHSVLGE